MDYKSQLLDTSKRIESLIHRTPVLTSELIDQMTGAQLYFKCENFQKMGAFKMRGAANAILQLSDEQRQRGVVTHSSGNFAQAVSLAARKLNVEAFIVMPSNAPAVKKEAVRDYGGIITECTPTIEAREEATKLIVKEKGASMLHPSNDIDVILGQGTAAVELLESSGDLDCILVPVGGGGLLAGTAMAARSFGVDCKTIGAEPAQADDAFRSLKSGKIEYNITAETIADGLRTHLGDINFPIIQKLVDRIITVEEKEIIAAMRILWERMKIVIEPSSAVPFAAVLKKKELFANKKIGIILSGGNVDLSKLPF